MSNTFRTYYKDPGKIARRAFNKSCKRKQKRHEETEWKRALKDWME